MIDYEALVSAFGFVSCQYIALTLTSTELTKPDKTVLNRLDGSLTRYYMGDYEEEIRENSSDIRKINYICGGNGLAAVYIKHLSGQDTFYYAHPDYQSSLIAFCRFERTHAGVQADQHERSGI